MKKYQETASIFRCLPFLGGIRRTTSEHFGIAVRGREGIDVRQCYRTIIAGIVERYNDPVVEYKDGIDKGLYKLLLTFAICDIQVSQRTEEIQYLILRQS